MFGFLKRTRSTAGAASDDPVTRADLMELTRQFKEMQRELDDLHAAYRRIRAASGGAARVAAAAGAAAAGDDPAPPRSRSDRKAALRQRAKKFYGQIQPSVQED